MDNQYQELNLTEGIATNPKDIKILAKEDIIKNSIPTSLNVMGKILQKLNLPKLTLEELRNVNSPKAK